MISFFVTATDTGVGKTFVSRGLAHAFLRMGKKTGYFKPFQSGVEENEPSDAQIVQEGAEDILVKNSYVTKTPCAPSLSAEIDGIEIELQKVREDYENFKKDLDVLIVEGSGGLFVPVAKSKTGNKVMSDIIKMLEIPALVVARPSLGTVNHTLMTLKCLDSLNIQTLGVVISGCDGNSEDPSILNAKKMIEEYCNHKVLEQIPQNAVQEDFSNLACQLSTLLAN